MPVDGFWMRAVYGFTGALSQVGDPCSQLLRDVHDRLSRQILVL